MLKFEQKTSQKKSLTKTPPFFYCHLKKRKPKLLEEKVKKNEENVISNRKACLKRRIEKTIYSMVVMMLIFCIIFTGCVTKSKKKEPASEPPPYAFSIDISEDSDEWNHLVLASDGSSMLINLNEETNLPSHMFLQANNESDTGITVVFKDNGLPDKIVVEDYILYIGNYQGYTFDFAIIYPNSSIEYHFGIETDVNWDELIELALTSRNDEVWRFLLSVGIATTLCGIATFFPPLMGSCLASVLSLCIEALQVMGYIGISGEIANGIINMLQCNIYTVTGALSCLLALENAFNMLSYLDFSFINDNTQEIAQAIGVIEGGRGDVKATLSWNNLADVDLHVICPHGQRIYYASMYSSCGGHLDFDNLYGYGPENIYWGLGAAPDGTFEVYVHFYGPGTSGANNSSSEFTITIFSAQNSRTYSGEVFRYGGYLYVASMNNNGNIWRDPQLSLNNGLHDVIMLPKGVESDSSPCCEETISAK